MTWKGGSGGYTPEPLPVSVTAPCGEVLARASCGVPPGSRSYRGRPLCGRTALCGRADTMADSDTPGLPRLLPDAVHRSVEAGTALLRVETAHAREGILDGALCPRSRDIGAEPPSLISALTEYVGPVTRVGLDSSAWDELPTRVMVDDRAVRIDSFPVGDDTVLITPGERDYFSLMLVSRARRLTRHTPRWPGWFGPPTTSSRPNRSSSIGAATRLLRRPETSVADRLPVGQDARCGRTSPSAGRIPGPWRC
ncbi:DUF5994 family protein [Streptomyces sp. NPDC002514]|uniref:DUF5994 family protein n=1 Tax=unclassified Streptomyces TaxID=2593676 RepID=UPI00369FB512